ncbi:MAG: tetratricopeptide (TPR) repeat protein [Candidatus Aldehydirespiratoraceae bacterium]|jgi:tetratricopeptide (TPR) repeat protein
MRQNAVGADFVGRSLDLSRLDASRAAASIDRNMLVVGPAGMGKTTLLQAFRARAVDDGAVVGWGVAGEWDGAPGLWPWFEALSDVDPHQTVISAGHDDSPSPPDMAEMFRSVAQWLILLGRDRNVVIVLEDLHYAHPTAVSLFGYLSRRPAIAGVSIIASSRPGNETIDMFRCSRIVLDGLSRSQVMELASATGRELDTATVVELVRRTNGNPLFVRRLLEQGANRPDSPVPPDVAALLRQQVAAAPLDVKPALDALSVLGSASIDVLQRMTTGAPVGPALARVSGDVIAIADGIASFRHGLLREVIYDDLEPEQRFALHAIAADVLRAEGSSPVALAHHLSRAAHSHRGLDAAEAACQAARIERSTGAISEAVHHFGIAVSMLRSLDDAGALAEALIEEAEALALMGRGAEAERCLIDAAASSDQAPDARRRRLVRAYGRLRWLEEPNPSTLDAGTLLSIATRWFGTSEHPADIAVLNTAIATAGDIRGGLLEDVEAADRAVAAATESTEPVLLGEAHLARRRALSVHPERLLERRADAETALRIAHQLEDHEFLIRAQRMALTDALASADRVRVSALLSSKPVSVAGRVQQALAGATVAALEGRYRDADDVLDETLKELDYLDIDAPALEFVRIVYAWDRGDLAAVIAEYEPLVPLIADPALRSAVALAKAIDGDHAVARLLIDEVLGTLRSDQPTILWAVTMGLLSEAATAIDHPCAAELYEMLRSFGGECVVSATSSASWIGSFDRYLGLLALRLGRNIEAAEHLESSLVIHDRMHALPWAARSHAALAIAQARLGDAKSAAHHASVAGAIADEVGMSVRMTLIGDYEAAAPVLQTFATPAGAVLERRGDVWSVGLDRDLHLVQHSKGLDYLARLIADPHRDWYALDLYAVVDGLPVLVEGDTGPQIDAVARRAYQTRYLELVDTLDRATSDADLGTAEAAQSEIDQLESELIQAFGLGGRSRTTGDQTEKARVNVRRSISRAIDRIRTNDPNLADHLDRSIRTGRFCRYDPAQHSPFVWRVSAASSGTG